MLSVPMFMFVLPPLQAIPLAIALDVFIALLLLPSVMKVGVDWHSVRPLVIATIPFIPLGVLFVKYISIPVVYAVVGIVLLIATVLLSMGFRFEKSQSRLMTFAVGATSGFMGGMAGMSGPPVILFYMAGKFDSKTGRASMMAFFVFSAFAALILQTSVADSWDWMDRLPWLLPPVMLGAYLGHRKFLSTDEKTFRRYVFGLLFVLSLSLIVKSFSPLT